MRRLIGDIFPFILVFLVVMVVLGLGFTIVGGLAIGLGHLLTRVFPFSLFEATLLSMVFATSTIYVITRLASQFIPSSLSSEFAQDQTEDEEWAAERMRIPTARFYKTDNERTWEAWLRAEIANDIYAEFQEAQFTMVNLNETQMQELAIRLSDTALSILKRKRGGRGRLKITMSGLKRELSRMGQRAYDDHIMHLALAAINMNLDYYAAELMGVIRTQAWNELSDAPEA